MATVTISADRLRELELAESQLEIAESQLPIIKEKLKKANHCQNNPERVHAYDKAHPEKVAERQKRYMEKNRDAHNAKRREKYRLKKELRQPPGGYTTPAPFYENLTPALS